jgi:hypothetical protein
MIPSLSSARRIRGADASAVDIMPKLLSMPVWRCRPAVFRRRFE